LAQLSPSLLRYIIAEMVVRYGAVDGNEEELNNNADNISEDNGTLLDNGKSILLGNVLQDLKRQLFHSINYRCYPVRHFWGTFYSKQFCHQSV
jgi:hypothetical protein